MTKEELKSKTPQEVIHMFGSNNKHGDIYYYYPMLTNNEEEKRYEIQDLFVDKSKYIYLMEYPYRFSVYVDNLFAKYNIVELLTDIDDTMMEFGGGYVPSLKKIKEKYPNKDIVLNGYRGFCFGDNECPKPIEYVIP